MADKQDSTPKKSKTGPLSFYQKTAEEVFDFFKVSFKHGLTDEEVNKRQALYGENRLPEGQQQNVFFLFLNQFKDFLTLVLIVAAIIAYIIGENADVYTILAIVFLNAILGFTQEYRAEKALAALKLLTSHLTKVRRNNQIIQIPTYQLVPGDVVYLEAGDMIPADIRIIESSEFKTDESTLTGEAQTIHKTDTEILDDSLIISDQKNMAFKGTLVTNGKCKGVVVAIGEETELGKIGLLLQKEIEIKTPLQNRLNLFAKRLSIVVLFICLFIFTVGIIRGQEIILAFMTSLSLAVAAIPEALPAIIIMTLSLGARIMSKQKALVRKLPAVETLGSVTVICSDKTGTLTLNKMQVTSYFVDNRFHSAPNETILSENWKKLLISLALNNDSYTTEENKIQGEPTEVALYEAALNYGYNKENLKKDFPRIAEIPFSSERGMMVTIHKNQNNYLTLVKGAPEKIIHHCQDIDKQTVFNAIQKMSSQGLRVLALAQKESKATTSKVDLSLAHENLNFIGLVGMMDPPRKEVKKSIELCKASGIKVVMITGDHPSTAIAIAEKINLINTPASKYVLTGTQLNELSDKELSHKIESIRIFARLLPEQKIRIVKAFQNCGEIVAMTGDGVNDAPALKRADVGVSMGMKGTDVARESSHIILLDDNFATIVKAIQEGRRIYDNIRKFIRFALAGNSGEIWTILLSPLLGIPTALLPIQILWINLITDGLPGLALVNEPGEKDIMERNPRPPNESLFAGGLWQHSIWVGILIGLLTLIPAAWAYHNGNNNWQTIAFTILTFSQLGHVMAIRSEKQSLLSIGVFSNMPLFLTIVFTVLLHLASIYMDIFNKIFKTKHLSFNEIIICFSISFLVFLAVELEKSLKRKRSNIN